MKEIIALAGSHNSGKTTTLNRLIALVEQKYPSVVPQYKKNNVDKVVVYDSINNLKVGIATGGDSGDIVKWQLNHFIKHNCDVIICATLTKGNTHNEVYAHKSTHNITFVKKIKKANDEALVAPKLMKTAGI